LNCSKGKKLQGQEGYGKKDTAGNVETPREGKEASWGVLLPAKERSL